MYVCVHGIACWAVDSEDLVNLTPIQPLQRCTDGGHSTLRGSSYTSAGGGGGGGVNVH